MIDSRSGKHPPLASALGPGQFFYSVYMMVAVGILVAISLLSIFIHYPLLPKLSGAKHYNNSGTVYRVEGMCDVHYCQEVFTNSPLAPESPAPSSMFLLAAFHLLSLIRRTIDVFHILNTHEESSTKAAQACAVPTTFTLRMNPVEWVHRRIRNLDE